MNTNNTRSRRSQPFTSDHHSGNNFRRTSTRGSRTTTKTPNPNVYTTDRRKPSRTYTSKSENSNGNKRSQGSRTPTYFSRTTRDSHLKHQLVSSRSRYSGNEHRRTNSRRTRESFDVSRYINLNPVVADTEPTYVPKHTFNDFGFTDDLATAIKTAKLTIPSPIQDQIIPHILEGRDVVGLAATGTGKTAAFLLPTIQKTLKQKSRQTLILAPTRELAIQVEQELRKLTPEMGIYSTVCVGGINIRPQIMGLRRKNHFIIGTPGRVQDLIDRGHIKPSNFSTVILDEADRMLDMGFIHDIKKILKDVPTNHETLFFSATMSKNIEGLINEFLRDPLTISVKKKAITSSVTQDVVYYESRNKFETLVELLKKPNLTRVLIFGAMKHSVEKLAQELTKAGFKADAIHGNKNHGQRQRALNNFKLGRVTILVATDVAARGIHIDNVSHVINYDLPNTFEDYIHRIGRTGRADKLGSALTFVTK